MKILLTHEQIQARIEEMAQEIDKGYEGQPYTVMALLNGACYFAVDLTRHLKGDFILDSVLVSSYVDDHSTGRITLFAGQNIKTVIWIKKECSRKTYITSCAPR